MSSSSESDIEIKKHSVPKKATKKTPASPSKGMLKNQEPKKVTTKQMIHDAIEELTVNNRKGVSLHAIKKYMVDKYAVDIDRIGFLIKKNIKNGIVDGTILQTKGIGVSGSFRMSAKKKEKKKEKKVAKTTKTIDKSDKKEDKKNMKVKINAIDTKDVKKKTDKIKTKTKAADKKEKIKKKGSEKETKPSKTKEMKSKERMMSNKVKKMATPAKRRAAMMKRKSIGTIIKPPKMKPKAKD